MKQPNREDFASQLDYERALVEYGKKLTRTSKKVITTSLSPDTVAKIRELKKLTRLKINSIIETAVDAYYAAVTAPTDAEEVEF